MIILRDIALRRGSKLLLQDANVTIQPGQRLALIGANGCGKSSLFALLVGELGADAGDIEGLSTLRLSHMAQEIRSHWPTRRRIYMARRQGSGGLTRRGLEAGGSRTVRQSGLCTQSIGGD